MPTSRATRVTSPAKRVELVDHRVDGLLQLQDFAETSTVIFLERSPLAMAVATSAMLRTWRGQVDGHRVDVVGQVLPGAGDAGHLRLAAELALRCRPRARRASLRAAKALSWSTIVLMVFFSSRISPCTSTVILRDRSPRATAVVTSAMLRTCAGEVAAHRVDASR